MKKIVVLIAILSIATVGYSQSCAGAKKKACCKHSKAKSCAKKATKAEMTPDQRIEKRIAKMDKELNLTNDQIAELRNSMKKNMEVKAQRAEENKQFRASMKNQNQAQLTEVLTAEQLKKLEAKKEVRLEKKTTKKASCGHNH